MVISGETLGRDVTAGAGCDALGKQTAGGGGGGGDVGAGGDAALLEEGVDTVVVTTGEVSSCGEGPATLSINVAIFLKNFLFLLVTWLLPSILIK